VSGGCPTPKEAGFIAAVESGDSTLPSARSVPGDFRRHLPHFEGRHSPLFITFTTQNRWPLPEEARRLTLQHILHDHHKKMSLICAVVLPDHVHLLYYPWNDPQGNRYSKTEIVGAIKSVSAHAINKRLGRKGAVWQDEFFDHVVRKDESIETKAQYILENPVRKGLCSHPDEYPFLWRAWVEGAEDICPLTGNWKDRGENRFPTGSSGETSRHRASLHKKKQSETDE
jgi:REP element-mobilizing transposase RayT